MPSRLQQPCSTFHLDLTAKLFSTCTCGHPKAAHLAATTQLVVRWGRKKKKRPTDTPTDKGTDGKACSQFRLDLSSKLFSGCKCGHPESAHSQTSATTPADEDQRIVFTNWCNVQLARGSRQGRVKNLFTDLRNGILLAELVSVVTGVTLSLKTSPTTKVTSLDNLRLVWDMLRQRGVPVSGLRPARIEEGNVKQTLALLWSLIRGYQLAVSGAVDASLGDIQTDLLCWLNARTTSCAKPAAHAQEFVSDPVRLTRLIQSFADRRAQVRPDEAMAFAHDQLGIPPPPSDSLLGAVVYLSYYRKLAAALDEQCATQQSRLNASPLSPTTLVQSPLLVIPRFCPPARTVAFFTVPDDDFCCQQDQLLDSLLSPSQTSITSARQGLGELLVAQFRLSLQASSATLDDPVRLQQLHQSVKRRIAEKLRIPISTVQLVRATAGSVLFDVILHCPKDPKELARLVEVWPKAFGAGDKLCSHLIKVSEVLPLATLLGPSPGSSMSLPEAFLRVIVAKAGDCSDEDLSMQALKAELHRNRPAAAVRSKLLDAEARCQQMHLDTGICLAQLVALSLYTSSLFYREVNAVLRDLDLVGANAWATCIFLAFRAILALSKRETTEFCHVVRGASRMDPEQYKEKSLVTFPAFTSTTTREEVSVGFGSAHQPARIKLKINTYAYVKQLSFYPGEEEYLVPPFSSFRIEQAQVVDGILQLSLEQVSFQQAKEAGNAAKAEAKKQADEKAAQAKADAAKKAAAKEAQAQAAAAKKAAAKEAQAQADAAKKAAAKEAQAQAKKAAAKEAQAQADAAKKAAAKEAQAQPDAAKEAAAKEAQMRSLHSAVRGGELQAVRDLLRGGADVEAKDDDGWTPLVNAVINKNDAVVRVLLQGGADVDAKDDDGWTPLTNAVIRGHDAVVRVLLEGGADVEAKSDDGRTPLVHAVCHEHDAVVRVLLEGGADVDAKSNDGRTPLVHAVIKKHDAVVRMLLEGGADVDAKCNVGWTPLRHAISVGKKSTIATLKAAGATA